MSVVSIYARNMTVLIFSHVRCGPMPKVVVVHREASCLINILSLLEYCRHQDKGKIVQAWAVEFQTSLWPKATKINMSPRGYLHPMPVTEFQDCPKID